jgi:ribosomal protein S6
MASVLVHVKSMNLAQVAEFKGTAEFRPDLLRLAILKRQKAHAIS